MQLSWKPGDPLPESHFKDGNVSLDGGSVHYYERGTGDPVFWFHGGPGANITPALLELSNSYRLIILEMPEWGGTTAFPGVDSLRGIAGLWARVIPQLAQPPVRLLGTSMGTSVALWIAVDHPDLVTSLVLESPFAIRPESAAQAQVEMTPEQQQAMRVMMLQHMPWMTKMPVDMGEMMQTVLKYAGPNVDEALIERMPSVGLPTLHIWGQGDQMFNPKDGPTFATAIPKSRLVYVAGAAHDVQGVRPEVFLDLVLDHFQRGDNIEIEREGIVIE